MAPFSTDKPRVPLTLMLDAHFILGVMALPSTVRYFEDLAYRLEVNRACNERLEATLGKRFYPEGTIHRFKGDFEVAMGQSREGVEYGFVLGLHADDMVASSSSSFCQSAQREIVTFGGTAGKDDLTRPGVDRLGDRRACVLHGFLALPAERVARASRIAIRL